MVAGRPDPHAREIYKDTKITIHEDLASMHLDVRKSHIFI